MKKCTECGIPQELSSFHKRKASMDGYQRLCINCSKVKDAVYYIKDRENKLKRQRLYNLNNKDKIRVYREINKESRSESHKEWKKNNRDKCTATQTLRESNKIKATPPWYDKDIIAGIYKVAKEKGLVVDHIVPLRSKEVCGLNVQDNLRCISAKLNGVKGNRYWSDMWDSNKAKQVLQA